MHFCIVLFTLHYKYLSLHSSPVPDFTLGEQKPGLNVDAASTQHRQTWRLNVFICETYGSYSMFLRSLAMTTPLNLVLVKRGCVGW